MHIIKIPYNNKHTIIICGYDVYAYFASDEF